MSRIIIVDFLKVRDTKLKNKGNKLIIISDCLKENLDEGCIKIASTLSKRLAKSGARLLAINCECRYADRCIIANKIYLNYEIYDFISEDNGNILYIPFASNTLGTAIRTWNLSRWSKRKVNVLFALRWKMNFLTKLIYRFSGCEVYAISQDSYNFFREELKGISIKKLNAGVDTKKFIPVDYDTKKKLREKYNLPLDKTIILHVGHLKYGRNVDVLLQLGDKYHGVLVFSSVTEQDAELKKKLNEKSNITIIDNYCPNIEEIYQASDIYVFPVVQESNSIDVPLSVLEAAACNIKIIATGYKEIGYFRKCEGLRIVVEQQLSDLNKLIEEMEQVLDVHTRDIALEYDWDSALGALEGFDD